MPEKKKEITAKDVLEWIPIIGPIAANAIEAQRKAGERFENGLEDPNERNATTDGDSHNVTPAPTKKIPPEPPKKVPSPM
jgi:hypothetical protein